MLKDGNAVANSIYNTSEVSFKAEPESVAGMGIALGADKGSNSMMTGLGPRTSFANLSSKILDKRFNKMLINMQNMPSKSGNQNGNSHDNTSDISGNEKTKTNENRKRKNNVDEQNV